MFDHTATIMKDFDSEKEAREYATMYAGDLSEWESFIVYDDTGELLYDTGWEKEEVGEDALDEFMKYVEKELGEEGTKKYIETMRRIFENEDTSFDDIINIALGIEGTVEDKLKNLFFVFGFFGLVNVRIAGFIRVSLKGNELGIYKKWRDVYRSMEDMKEINEENKQTVLTAGLQFGYCFKHPGLNCDD